MGKRQLIIVIDDQPLSQMLVAKQITNRSGIVIPEDVESMWRCNPCDFGLVIADRIMSPKWTEARDAFLAKLHPDTEVVEWSSSANLLPEDRIPGTVLSIQKRGDASELVPIVDRWVRYGTVIETADAKATA